MRHVGQKLGFVFRGQRQLLGFFLQRRARLLDLLILALHLGILIGKQTGLLFKLLVGFLQFLLLIQ